MKQKAQKFHMTNQERVQYVLTLVITLLALAVIVFYSFGSFYSVAREDAVTIGRHSVEEEAEKLNNFLLQGLDVLQVTGLVVDYMLKKDSTPEQIEAFLLQESQDYAVKIDKNFTGIYGLFNGEYLDGIGWVPEDDYVPQERPWYTTALKGKGEPVIVSPYLDAQTNSIMISVSQMLSDGESVISLDIVMDEVQEFAQNIQLDGNGYGFVIDKEGLVVAHTDEKQKGKNYLLDEDMQNSEIRKIVKRIYSAEGKTLNTQIDGKNCMVFSKVVQKDWYVVMIVNNEDLFYKVQDNLVRNIFISLIIFSVVVYFCTASYRNRMKATRYAEELKDYQLTLEERVLEQTQEITEKTDRLMQMQESVIEGMATLIESRDGNTGEHVRSTKKYVAMIVSYMYQHHIHSEEIDEVFVEQICNAAALHDIGKIKISDAVLNKPGRFTPEEYEIMKTHSQLGGEIVGDILGDHADAGLVQISTDVATYHHEKWDGTGYPKGLKGEQIPLCARIMAVADVFDALVSKRVYKDRMSTEEAFTILEEESGSHFDPQIVEIFFEVREDVEKYLKEIQEKQSL